MGGKAKPTKHTTKEVLRKTAAANTNMAGGKAGLEDRKGGKAGHSKFICHLCMAPAPSLASMKEHFDNKHPKLVWDPTKYDDLHEAQGGTTQGVAVRGSTRKGNGAN
jgi:hypothetical protein